eukprot:UN32504
MNSLDHDCIGRIIRLTVDDLHSFLQHVQSILEHILQHDKISPDHVDICYLCIMDRVFSTSIYPTLFNLYKIYNQNDDERLNRKLLQYCHLTPRDFGVSSAFCLDVHHSKLDIKSLKDKRTDIVVSERRRSCNRVTSPGKKTKEEKYVDEQKMIISII